MKSSLIHRRTRVDQKQNYSHTVELKFYLSPDINKTYEYDLLQKLMVKMTTRISSPCL